MVIGPPRTAFWADPRLRGVVFQAIALGLVVWLFWTMASNAADALRRSGQATGWGFLWNTAGFDIGFKLIDYTARDRHIDALVVGLLNTLMVSGLGIVLATLLGFFVGIARLSPNWLVSRMAAAYVEFVRNVPLLLWILFFYLALIPVLPPVKQALSLGDFAFLTNRGLYVPKLHWTENAGWILWALGAAIALAVVTIIWSRRRQRATGHRPPDLLIGAALIVALPVAAFFAADAPVSLEFPVLQGFNFRGGLSILPELVALLFALSIYTAAYIAEIVRSGIEGVSKGQSEAASALGLSRGQRLRLVVIPQAMRIIIPPLTSQYLNLTKNSSLAAAIAFPDLVHVFAGTSLTQTGQALEILAITAGIYLTISLVTSAFMNLYNYMTRLKER